MGSDPLNLLALDSKEFQKFLDSFDHVFSDCDGVIWAKTPLPGSGDFINLMKKHGKTVNFVSNNSLRTKENYQGLFEAAGIENGFENLTIPSIAIVEYLKSVKFDKKIYCVACAETIRMLETNGFECKYGPDLGVEYYGDFNQYLEDDEEIGAVIFDSDFRVNLPKLYKAITYLKRPEVFYLNGATDKLMPIAGTLALATGAFSDLVTDQAKREPIQMGKPGKVFGEFAMKRAKVTDPSRVLFIGDMIEQDIALGKAMGFKTLLVLTNLTKEDMLSHETIKPDYYADSLGSIVPLLEY